jgi:UDP-4-amino-4,6-dideoxy-N-acetyl-beta-L-altrosamine transaminase
MELAIYGSKPVRNTLLPYSHQTIDNNDINEVIKVLMSDYLTTGPKIEEFENCIKNYYNRKYAVAVNSGTSALHCSTHACEFKSDDEVIVSCMSFVASSNCILYENAKPIFCDIDPDTMNIDPNKIESLITKNTKALITIDFGGQLCDYDKIIPIVKKYNLLLIEDACHALGTKTCPEADFVIFSFHPVKHITTMEGGMVLTNNEKYYKTMLSFRTHGIIRNSKKKYYYEMVDLGFNFRIPDVSCALGISQMKKLDYFVSRRKEIAKIYDEKLKEFSNNLVPLICKNDNSYHLYIIKLLNLDRDTIFEALYKENIGVNVHYIPIHLHPYYQNKFNLTIPIAEKVYKQIITLPLFPSMDSKDIDDVIKAIQKVIKYYSISVVKVEKTEENAKLIHMWRNDEITRQMSFHMKIIEYNDFLEDFNNKYFCNDIDPLFITLNNEKIGYIGFIKDDNTYTLGINISPIHRNKGYGAIGLLKALQYVKKNHTFVKNIIAKIKNHNISSIRIFEKNDFRQIATKTVDGAEILVYERNL